MTEPKPQKIVVFGVGLIGGSFALALKKANVSREIVGYSRTQTTLDKALQLGIIDRKGGKFPDELKDADLVLLATPVGQMEKRLGGESGMTMEMIGSLLEPHTIVIDAGSTKSDVVKIMRIILGKRIKQFVPAHPIAGAEKSGPAAAYAELFAGKKVVLTPLPENPPEFVEKARKIWEACGAKVEEMSPEEHDHVFAAVSHLPHLLSFALVHDLSNRENRDQLLSFAASGFRDFTRIAASSPEMWRDICMANRDALINELDRYMKELEGIRQALDEQDSGMLEEIFSEARQVRSNWTQQ